MIRTINRVIGFKHFSLRSVPGENMVPEQASQSEASPRGGNREAEVVREAVVAPEFRLWANVLRSGATWDTRSASLHRGGHG